MKCVQSTGGCELPRGVMLQSGTSNEEQVLRVKNGERIGWGTCGS